MLQMETVLLPEEHEKMQAMLVGSFLFVRWPAAGGQW